MNKQRKQISQKLAFTLIELIIVITILAILATIAFMSFKNYSWNARDWNRLTTLSQIKTWLDLYHLKTWEYPFPEENIFTWMIQGKTLVYRWEISNDISRKINISKTPKDPNLETQNYAYGITYTKQEYQIWTLLENDISYMENPFVKSVYADTIYYKAGVKWMYKGFIKFQTWWTNHIANIPSLLYNFSWSIDINGVNLEDENVYFITNEWENLPYSLWKDIEINKKKSNIIIISEDEVFNYINNNVLPPDLDEESLLWGFWVENKKDLETLISGKTPQKNGNNNFWTWNVILSRSQVDQWDTLTISNDCSISPTSYVSSNDNIARIIDQEIRTYSAGNVTISPVWWVCENNNWVLLIVVPSELWKQEDSNCKVNDFVFSVNGEKYIWGWCNSTFWTWLTFQNDNDNSCRNYEWRQKNQLHCEALSPINYYNSLGVWWAREVDTIWGQLYTWNQASIWACPSWWHLSTDEEWEILETYLNDGINCRNAQDDWQCSWLGWSGKQNKKTYNNIVNALQLPLSGNRDWYFDDEGKLSYHARWERTLLWTSKTKTEYESYYRYFNTSENKVYRIATSNDFWFSARCVKNR